ncbi:MAG TPA: tetraacyldisaccharide 4'-kinase [Lentisphaeria bacterium]|nr:MAG: tetraacyldisaccharide 4'-kinase [Lentisphaerae bacterium GWF2_38_69]HBM15619.1 tetraacyldisaccharide 4'-kinase [Lentisphaeria bacterium]
MSSYRNIIEKIERFMIDVINEKSYSTLGIFIRGILFWISRIYRNVVQFRLWAYEKGIIKRSSLGCLVVSIGNLTCGGTGKTPVVEVFAKTLSKKGRRVAILSRGYKSRDRTIYEKFIALITSKENKIPPRIVSDGENLLLNPSAAGDEPYMLASNLKNVVVLVDKDRVKSGRYAIREFESDVLILDDGFQYLNLKPHVNIVLVDSTFPFHNHHVLPRGLLREPIKNLRRADYVFLTKSNGGNHIRHLKKFVVHHNRKAEIIECCHKPLYLERVFERGERMNLYELRKRNIAALCGIAAPESFEKFLTDFGANIVYKRSYADHHNYTQQEIIDFIVGAKKNKADMIVTTEKDAVRIPLFARRDIEFYFLRVEIDIISGLESFEQCISRICFN